MAVPTQEPLPLQRSVWVTAMPSSQVVLLPTLAQARLAAHNPVLVLHTGVAAAVEHMGSAVPTSLAEQVPSTRPFVVLLHASHGPLQAVSQQTPSAHESPVL